MVSALKRTWSPRQQTPVVKTSLSHRDRANIVGAVAISPNCKKLELQTRLYRRTITGEQILVFLKTLLRRFKGPIVLVWDNHGIHGRQIVKQFVTQHKRLHVYNLPKHAPELNPTEGVWAQLENWTAGKAPLSIDQLVKDLRTGTHRIRRSQRLLRACPLASGLPGIRKLIRS